MRDYLIKSTNVIIAIMNQQRKYTFRNTLNQFMKVELSHVHNVISKQNINKTLKDTRNETFDRRLTRTGPELDNTKQCV